MKVLGGVVLGLVGFAALSALLAFGVWAIGFAFGKGLISAGVML